MIQPDSARRGWKERGGGKGEKKEGKKEGWGSVSTLHRCREVRTEVT